jgi:hypothetical protein
VGQLVDDGEHPLALLVGVGEALHRQRDVVALEPGEHDERLAEGEPVDDVLLGRQRGGRGHGDDAGRAELLDQLAEPQVVGTEVVSPRGHAVRLVDRDERRLQGGDVRQHVGGGQLLGGEQEEAEAAVARRGEDPRALLGRLRRAQPRGAETGRLQRGHLILLQREQRGDDDRAAVEQQAGELVGQGLAGPGGCDEQHVASVEERLHGLLLPGQQLPVPEPALGGLAHPRGPGGSGGRVRHAAGVPRRRCGYERLSARLDERYVTSGRPTTRVGQRPASTARSRSA